MRGVDADGQPAGAGIEVIARQRALMPDIERAVGVERERMRGEHRAVGDQLPNVGLDFAMVHDGTSYPNSGPATANGGCAERNGRRAKAHALKRPLDVPARCDEAAEKLFLRMDGVDQPRARLGADDGVHQRERLIGAIGQQRADMARGASVADEGHGSIVRHDARARARGKFRQQRAAVEPHGAGIACDQGVEVTRR